MKINKIALSVFAFTFFAISCKKNEETTAVVATEDTTNEVVAPVLAENLKTASFTIDGMSCQVMCASKIQKELEATTGVQKAIIDFEKKSGTVEYDAATTSPEKISEVVETVGGGDLYKVSNLTSTADQAFNYFQEDKKKSRKEKRQERANKKNSSAVNSSADAPAGKPGCCSSKKSCSKSEAQKS